MIADNWTPGAWHPNIHWQESGWYLWYDIVNDKHTESVEISNKILLIMVEINAS